MKPRWIDIPPNIDVFNALAPTKRLRVVKCFRYIISQFERYPELLHKTVAMVDKKEVVVYKDIVGILYAKLAQKELLK